MTPTKRIVVEVPEGTSEEGRQKAFEAAVLALWEAGEISASFAAEELGLSMHEFLDLLAVKGLPVESGPLNLEAIEAARRKLAGKDQENK